MRTRASARPIAVIATIAFATPVALAQQGQPADATPTAPAPSASTTPAPATTAQSGGLSFALRGSGEFTFRSDIDDTPGSVQIWRAGFGFDIATPIGDRGRLSVGVDEEVSWYLFKNATGLLPGSPAIGDPFENVLQTRIVPTFSMQQSEHWGWFVGGFVEFAGERDVDLGDAATFGGFGGVRYSFSDNFSMSFGLGGKSRLEDSALFIPLVGVNWKINDKVTLSTEGAKAKIAVKLSDQLSTSLFGGWELREYRLDDDSPLPEGVIRDSRIPIGVSLDWKPCASATISLAGGAVVWQEFKFDDRNGDRVSETNTDATGFVGLTAEIKF